MKLKQAWNREQAELAGEALVTITLLRAVDGDDAMQKLIKARDIAAQALISIADAR